MTVVLTKAGFENLEDVLAAVFSYLKMMERVGVSERIFKEIKEIEDLDFEFREIPYETSAFKNKIVPLYPLSVRKIYMYCLSTNWG